jgi:hypothetical protein
MPGPIATTESLRRFLAYLVLLGLFLTFRGYRSREVDQAYRLPILLHQQDARLFADDPFVRSFDQLNPHRGYLALLDVASRSLGLSAALVVLFALTFLLTVYGVDRLTSAVWSDQGKGTGLVAACLILVALAGNIGTNHLFEPMLLDRLIAFGLGWVALASVVEDPRRGVYASAIAVGLSALVHPSVGLQLAMLLGASWLGWVFVGPSSEIGLETAVRATALLALGVVPGLALNIRGSRLLFEGLSPEDLLLLSAELQSPQHMLPHLWRLPQWLAWGCYPILALISIGAVRAGDRSSAATQARARLLIVLGMSLAGLVLAWIGIEALHHLRLTLFQPFRMATVARGLCLVLIAGRVRQHWEAGGVTDRLRSVLIGVGLLGDWMLVVATLFEVTMTVSDAANAMVGPGRPWMRTAGPAAGLVVLAAGIAYLSRHDTESGHVPLLAAVVATVGFGRRIEVRRRDLNASRVALRLAACWAVPVAALLANLVPEGAITSGRSVRQLLVRRCRFGEVPIDDVERLAVWCRTNTPPDALFIGPPGPKTFRLWSLRSLAFNRAGSPYHAAGLADWSRRFREHVDFEGTNEEFVHHYLKNRHELEHRYDALSDDRKAALAAREGAGYVVAEAPGKGNRERSENQPLVFLHAEGQFAVYRVNRPLQVAGRQAVGTGQGHRR